MSVNYKPLDHFRGQIRVLTIHSPASPSTAPAGRTCNPWKPRYHNLDSEHEYHVQNGSAVRLNPVDEMIRCTIDTVSLDDVTEGYRAYQRAPAGETTWPEYLEPQQLSISDNASEQASATPLNTVFDLPPWRFASWTAHHSLDERVATLTRPKVFAPRYKWGDFCALSYTWGDEEALAKIIMNGEIISIPKNAEAALRRLRTLPETALGMRYWIDALCINQSDTAECSKEVKRMGNLYKAAWSIIVWLGEAADQSDEACDLICGVSYVVDLTILTARPDLYKELVTAKVVFQLLSRPYWSRAWIIQELAMNHNNTMFLCGDRAFFRQELGAFLHILLRAFNDFIGSYTNTPNAGMQKQDADSITLCPNLWALVEHIMTLLVLNATEAIPGRLESILALSKRAFCKDPRDKVYSIINLLPEALASLIQPDYNLPVAKVHEDFSRKLVAVRGLDFLLSWAGQPKSDSTASWCIEWTNLFPRKHFELLKRRAAHGGMEFSHRFIKDGILVCEGVQVDMVESLAPGVLKPSDLDLSPPDHEPSSPLPPETPVIDDPVLARALVDTLLLQHPYKSTIPRSILNIPWTPLPQLLHHSDRTASAPQSTKDALTNSARFWVHIAPSSFFAPFDKFRRENSDFVIGNHTLRDFFPARFPSLELSRPPSPVMLDVQRDGVRQQIKFSGYLDHPLERASGMVAHDMKFAAMSLVGRRLAITRMGKLALVPEDARVGDIVAVVECPFPVLLRPGGDGYRFVGECFVHGIMDGEGVRGESVRSEEFVIF